MTSVSPRAQALIAELARYMRKYGNDVDRSHVEDLEAHIRDAMDAEVITEQNKRARIRPLRTAPGFFIRSGD